MKESKGKEHRITIVEEIRDLQPFVKEACIFRVHAGLRKSNPRVYEPMLVSIGPYHQRDRQLLKMREYKLRYLKSFIEGMDAMKRERIMQAELKVDGVVGSSESESYLVRHLMKEMKQIEARARKFYAEPIGLKSDEFVEMMLLDACFVIEFIRKCCDNNLQSDDPIFNIEWMGSQILRDLILLENQLPYFVLSELYNMIEDPKREDQVEKSQPFMTKVMEAFSYRLRHLRPISKFVKNSDEIKHLLQVLHISCHPPSQEIEKQMGSDRRNDSGSEILHQMHSVTELHDDSDNDSESESEMLRQMHNVTELHEAGVEFKNDKKAFGDVSDNTSLFDIKFENSLLVIPSVMVEDWTETFFRNLVAYEQQTSDVQLRYISDYIYFMDQLINIEKDVGLLRQREIIINLLGDDKEVARLFNRLGDGVTYSCPNFYYLGICKGLNQHCKQRWNTFMARLRHDYFYSPWATASTIAAIMLLLLTATQTVATLLSTINGWK